VAPSGCGSRSRFWIRTDLPRAVKKASIRTAADHRRAVDVVSSPECAPGTAVSSRTPEMSPNPRPDQVKAGASGETCNGGPSGYQSGSGTFRAQESREGLQTRPRARAFTHYPGPIPERVASGAKLVPRG